MLHIFVYKTVRRVDWKWSCGFLSQWFYSLIVPFKMPVKMPSSLLIRFILLSSMILIQVVISFGFGCQAESNDSRGVRTVFCGWVLIFTKLVYNYYEGRIVNFELIYQFPKNGPWPNWSISTVYSKGCIKTLLQWSKNNLKQVQNNNINKVLRRLLRNTHMISARPRTVGFL